MYTAANRPYHCNWFKSMLLVWVPIVLERAKSSILPNGNFREFFLWRGGEFCVFKTGIPGGPDDHPTGLASNTVVFAVRLRRRWLNNVDPIILHYIEYVFYATYTVNLHLLAVASFVLLFIHLVPYQSLMTIRITITIWGYAHLIHRLCFCNFSSWTVVSTDNKLY